MRSLIVQRILRYSTEVLIRLDRIEMIRAGISLQCSCHFSISCLSYCFMILSKVVRAMSILELSEEDRPADMMLKMLGLAAQVTKVWLCRKQQRNAKQNGLFSRQSTFHSHFLTHQTTYSILPQRTSALPNPSILSIKSSNSFIKSSLISSLQLDSPILAISSLTFKLFNSSSLFIYKTDATACSLQTQGYYGSTVEVNGAQRWLFAQLL